MDGGREEFKILKVKFTARFCGVYYKISPHEALRFEMLLCFVKLLYFEIPFYFEILPCFETLPRRPEILRGGLNEILRREILRSGFYLSNFIGLARRRACIDQASIEFYR